VDEDETLDVALPKTAELDKLGTEVDTDGGEAKPTLVVKHSSHLY